MQLVVLIDTSDEPTVAVLISFPSSKDVLQHLEPVWVCECAGMCVSRGGRTGGGDIFSSSCFVPSLLWPCASSFFIVLQQAPCACLRMFHAIPGGGVGCRPLRVVSFECKQIAVVWSCVLQFRDQIFSAPSERYNYY